MGRLQKFVNKIINNNKLLIRKHEQREKEEPKDPQNLVTINIIYEFI